MVPGSKEIVCMDSTLCGHMSESENVTIASSSTYIIEVDPLGYGHSFRISGIRTL